MIAYALAFISGDLILQQFSQLPSFSLLLILSGIAVIMAWLRYRVGLFLIIGFLWASAWGHYQLNERLSSELEGIAITVTGKIANLPDQNVQHANFDFIVQKSSEKLPHKLKLNWYEPTTLLHAGEYWKFVVKLKRPHATFNLGSHDYESWLLTQNIGATGTVSKNSQLFIAPASWFNIDYWRQRIGDTLIKSYGNNTCVALLKALTIGDDNNLSPNNWDTFRITGTTHLIVISGSHIALVAGLIYWLTLKLSTRLNIITFSPPRIAILSSLLTALGYASLSGFVIPTKRAVIMLGIVALASFYQRQLSPLQSISIALLSMLIFNPTMLLSTGFWLSFLAVALILYRMAGRLKVPTHWLSGVDIQLTVSLGLSPLLLFYFQQMSLISPLVNFIAVPIVELFVVPLALLQLSFMLIFPWLADKLFILVELILRWLMKGLEFAETLPYASIDSPAPSFFVLFLSGVGLLWLFAPRGIPARGLGLVLNLPIVFPVLPVVQNAHAVVTVLDVGQGLAVTVQTANHWLLYDTGSKFPSGGDMGKNVILPFLRYQGVKKLDMLLISHSDNDHIGGAASVLQQLPVNQILTSAPEKFIPYSVTTCQAGQSWTWDEVTFSILSPATIYDSDNNNSCVLKVEIEQREAVLLTGDIEAAVENILVEHDKNKLAAKILLAPHHGSKTSSTWAFLEAVKPDIILIPAGYRNSFHHPNKEIIMRYQSIKAQYFTSANSGAMTVKLDSKNTIVENLRETDGKYWN